MFVIFEGIIIYMAVFISLYMATIWLLILWENKNNIYKPKLRRNYPSVCIIVPCFNEASTIIQTVRSLIQLDYPKDKLEILIIDDGSKDDTYQRAEQLLKHPQVKLFHKENGGKHTALNYGISKTNAEFIGCLDADSFVAPNALKLIMTYFADLNIVAVTSALKIYRPQNTIQRIQSIEYIIGIALRKALVCLDSLTVIPGPFSIYRKNIFQKIGLFIRGHNTEDMEIAFRIQSNNYRIATAVNAYVWTSSPSSLKALQQQRKRWLQGFIRNLWDYRHLIFNKQYGDLGIFILPIIVISVLLFMIVIPYTILRLFYSAINYLFDWSMVGHPIYISSFNFNWFFINTSAVAFIGSISLLLVIIFFFIAKKISHEQLPLKTDLLIFMLFYNPLLFIWWLSAVYDVVLRKTNKWRPN